MLLKIFFFLFFSVLLQAQTADEIIKKVQNKFSEIKTIKADFNQTIFANKVSKPYKLAGKFYFMKKDNFKIELPSRKIISDGKTTWNYDEKQNKVIISDFDEENIGFSLNNIIYGYPAKCKLTLVNKKVNGYVIKAVPINSELNFKEAVLFINKNFVLTEIEITDYNNMKYSFKLFSIVINPTLNKNIFHFSPSNTVEVIDLR
jgi:chaperone LolA